MSQAMWLGDPSAFGLRYRFTEASILYLHPHPDCMLRASYPISSTDLPVLWPLSTTVLPLLHRLADMPSALGSTKVRLLSDAELLDYLCLTLTTVLHSPCRCGSMRARLVQKWRRLCVPSSANAKPSRFLITCRSCSSQLRLCSSSLTCHHRSAARRCAC